LGGDPAPNIIKEMRVEYECGGKTNLVTVLENKIVQENQELRLPEDARALMPPGPRVSLAQGNLVLAVAEPGADTFSTATGQEKTVEISSVPKPVEIAGPWAVVFPEGRGAPAQATFERLISWPDQSGCGNQVFFWNGSLSEDGDHSC
jgi:hypothetical protein